MIRLRPMPVEESLGDLPAGELGLDAMLVWSCTDRQPHIRTAPGHPGDPLVCQRDIPRAPLVADVEFSNHDLETERRGPLVNRPTRPSSNSSSYGPVRSLSSPIPCTVAPRVSSPSKSGITLSKAHDCARACRAPGRHGSTGAPAPPPAPRRTPPRALPVSRSKSTRLAERGGSLQQHPPARSVHAFPTLPEALSEPSESHQVLQEMGCCLNAERARCPRPWRSERGQRRAGLHVRL
jgi:hypothetical protein